MTAINQPSMIHKRTLRAIFLTSLLTLFALSTEAQWLAGYDHRKEIVLDGAEIAGALSDFPVLIQMTDTDLRDNALASGHDIVFAGDDGTTLLDHDLESYDPGTGALVAWVKVENMAAATDETIYMYFGNTSATDPSTDSDLVWDTDHVGVWHLGGSYVDVSGSGNDFTNTGTVSTTGQVGDGASFVKADQDNLETAASADFDLSLFTISFWMNANSFADWDRIVTRFNNTTPALTNYGLFRNSTGGVLFEMTHSDNNVSYLHSNATINTGTWYHIAMVLDGTHRRLYINGAEDRSAADTRTSLTLTSPEPFVVGYRPDNNQNHFDGVIDEVRVSQVGRSAAWIATSYNNQSDPAGFVKSTGSIEDGCLIATGTLLPAQSAVESGGSTTITVTGYEAGATLQWQSSTDNISFTDIPGATSATLNTGALTQASYFRVQVTMGCTATSASTQIGIVATGLSGYDYRRQITLDGTKIIGSHTGFPFLVKLTGLTSPKVTNANGYDIVFTGSDGTTTLPHEIHFYDNGTGEYMAWVKMDMTAATDETLYVYYGNSSVTTDPSSTDVWDANYGAVLHLQESGNGSDNEYQDATSNDIDGTGGGVLGAGNSGRTPTRVNGLFGYAQDFNDANEHNIRLNTLNDDSWGAVTVETWIYAHDTNDDRLFGKNWGTNCGTDQTWLLRKTGTNVSARLRTDTDNSCGLDRGTYAINTWHHMSMTWDGATSTMRVFIDGVEQGSETVTGNDFDIVTGSDMPIIGNTPAFNRGYDGLMQEARVSNVARSTDYLRTTYLNQLDAGEGGFIKAVGTEEEVCSVSTGSLALSNGAVNAGGSTTILASGYEVGGTLQWQSSTDNVNFANISGATTDFLSTGPLTQTTYFRLAVNKICTDFSSAVTVTVGGVACAIASGSVAAVRDEIFDGETATLTLFGYEPGATFQWQSSTDNVTFSDIGGETGTTLTTGALSNDTYFRVTVTNGCSINTPTVQVAVVKEFISGYAFRKKITLDGASIFGSHTDFPVLISIASDADLQAGVTNGNGYDILFTDADGTTLLSHDLESYDNSSGALLAWVKTNLTDATDKELYIYYGNSTIGSDQSSTATWSTDYVGVWHFDGDPSLGVNDATTNNNDGVQQGGMNSSNQVVGQIGSGYNFDRVDGDHIDVADNSTLRITSEITISIWGRATSFDPARFAGLINKSDGANTNYGFFYRRPSTYWTPTARLNHVSHPATADPGIDDGNWHYHTMVYNDAADIVTYFVDGVQVGPAISTSESVTTNGAGLEIGAEGNGDYWDGQLDEGRVINALRTADWIKTEYFNQNDPASFLTMGAEEGCMVESGALAAADDLVGPGETTTLTVSGYTDGATLQWESSTDNITFTELVGETTATLTTSTISQTTYFRVKVTKTCDSYTDAITLSLDPSSGYAYRKKITLEGSEIAGNHTDFPVLVRLASDADLQANVTNANGYDIIFTDADGKTALPFELEKYVSGTGELVAWVKTDLTVSSSKEIYMYYGNSSVSGPSHDVANTWNSNYQGVYHLNQSSSDAIGTAASPAENNTANASGIIGDAYDFVESSTAYVNTGFTYGSTVTNQMSVSAWVNVDNSTDDHTVLGTYAFGSVSEGFLLWMDYQSSPGFAFGITSQTSDFLPVVAGESSGVTGLVGNWHHVVGTWDGANVALYVNGVLVDNAAMSDPYKVSTEPMAIGAQGNFGRLMDGLIDEARFLSAALDANWILTEYNNQRDGSTFLTLGAEESGCDFSAGVASAASSDLYSGEATVVTVSGFAVGSTIQWQQSAAGGNYTDVAVGSGATTPSYATGTLTSATYFRAAITNGSCTNYSSPVLVSITPPFIPNYSHRMKMTIPASKVSGVDNLVDFPLLVEITNDSLRTDVNGGNVLNSSGFDIQFADGSGNLFSYEREEYDAVTGHLRAWVKVPVLSASADTELYLYYGNCDGTIIDPSSSNAWNSNFKAVYHMEDAGDQTDAKGSNDLTNDGTVSAAGQIGNSRDFEASETDGLIFPNNIDIVRNVSAISVQTWVNLESSSQNAVILGLTTGAGGSTSRVSLEAGRAGAEGRFRFGGRSDDSEGFRETQESSVTTTTGTWYHVVGTLDYPNDEIRLYINGVEASANLSAAFGAASSQNTTSVNARIGAEENNSSRHFDGLIDEVRILDTELTADWIKTEYDNQVDPSSFFTLSSEETQVQWHGSMSTVWSESGNWSTCVLPNGETVVRIPDVGNDPVLDMNASVDNLIIESAGVLSLGSFTLEVSGDIENNGVLSAANGLVRFTGDDTQRFTGNAVTLDNMVVDKAPGSILELYQSITVEENLTLSSGMISLNGGDLILSNATMAGGGRDAFIATPTSYCLRQNVDNTDVLFPVGASTGSYTPAILNNSGTADIFCIRVVNKVFKDGLETGEEFTEGVVGNTWFIDETTEGASNVSLTLEWRNSDQKTNFVPGNARLTHYNSTLSGWESKASTAVLDKGEGRFSITATGLDNFSPHGVGSDVEILPIELIFFDANYQQDEVLVTWATASEIDNDFFSVERGTNGEDFEVIANVPGQGNSNERMDYQYTDDRPLPGGSYYRLKQTDFDGSYTHSEIAFVFDGQERSAEIAIFPNASDGINFTWSLTGMVPNTEVEIKLFDLDGAELISQVLQLDSSGTYRGKGFERVSLRPGVYLLRAVNQGQRLVHRIVVH